MRGPVVADASLLIGCGAAGAFELLRELYGTLLITRIVLEEVRAGGDLPGRRELEEAMGEGWIRVAPTPIETWSMSELDAGEASTIALAIERRTPEQPALVLMDDALGRLRAEAVALDVLGITDVLLAAKRASLIEAVLPYVERLARRGLTLPPDAARRLLLESGESERR